MENKNLSKDREKSFHIEWSRINEERKKMPKLIKVHCCASAENKKVLVEFIKEIKVLSNFKRFVSSKASD